jgi:hypothetical protein
MEMEIMVTVPEEPAEREALARRAAQLLAEAIRGIFEGLRCPAAQKSALLRSFFWEQLACEAENRPIREHKLTKS